MQPGSSWASVWNIYSYHIAAHYYSNIIGVILGGGGGGGGGGD